MATVINYAIFMTDLAQVHALQAQFPNGIQIPPAAAAAAYNVPLNGTNDLDHTGGIVVFKQMTIGGNPDLTGAYNTQTFQLTFTDANAQASPGFPNPYPYTLDCYWVGMFLGIGSKGAQPPVTPRYIGARRWVDGFEVPTLGEGGSGQGQHNARAASRTPDGMGFAYRSNSNDVRTHTLPASVKVSWERFYIQLLTLPVGGDDNIWACKGSVDAGSAGLINVNTNGTLQAYSKGNAAYPGTSLGTTAALTVGRWYRVDVRMEFLTTTTAPTNALAMSVYLNGTLQFSGVGGNISSGQNHQLSNIGGDVTATSHGLECNIDDWNNTAEVSINTVFGLQKYPGNDLTSGSHIKIVRPLGFTGSHDAAAWTGDWRALNNNPANTSGATTGVISNTGAVTLQVDTDYTLEQFGCACMSIGTFMFQIGGGAGSLSISTNVGDPTLQATVTAAHTFAASVWSATSNLYTIGTGATADALPPLGTVQFTLVPGPNAGNNQVVGLFGAAEMLGIFGPEDYNQVVAPNATYTPRVGIHSGPYPNLQVNHTLQGPIAGVQVTSGTYTGNDLGQDVFAQFPAHFWFVRPLSGSNDGVLYWTSMMAAHRQLPRKFQPEGMPEARIDGNGSPLFQVAGTAAVDNANAVTYQYIGVSDLAMRFMMNGAFAHKSTLAVASNPLVDPLFTPDAAFIFKEDYASGATGSYYKGPGHTGYNATPLDAAEAADIMSFSAGAVGSKTALNTDVPQTAYCLWRKDDGLGGVRWLDIVTYVGTGGPRSIAVSLNGQSPLFVFGVPHDGVSYYKDPSHTGSNSSAINGAPNTATAITGGSANTVTVGATMNALGVTYDLFVIGGSSTAFQNGNYTAAGALQRTGGPWVPNPPPVVVTPIVLNVVPMWRLHRFDMKPRTEQRS